MTERVVDFSRAAEKAKRIKAQEPLGGGGGSGNDGGMDSRVTVIETRLDTVLPTVATKADLSATESKLVRWVTGIGIASVTVLISILSFLASRVEMRAPPPTAPPVIINIPGALQGAASAQGSAEGHLNAQPQGK